MKVVIFAGGLGSRISEESHLRPKPMIEIGGKPILWHILKIYQSQGFKEFIICLGYKGYIIKEYFINYFYHNADITVDLSRNQIQVHRHQEVEDIRVTLVETGLHTMTAGRLFQVAPYIPQGEDFMLTYGDGVADVDLQALLQFHRQHGRLATVTTVQPAGKFGVLEADEEGLVHRFVEKPKGEGTWINGGFFVLNQAIFDYFKQTPLSWNDIMWEEDPMRELVAKGELRAYRHYGFWKCMDILRDKVELERFWNNQQAPWKIW